MVDLSRLPFLLVTEDWAAAEALLRRASQSDDASATVYFNLAKVLEKQGRADERKAWLSKALQTNPQHARGWYEMGCVHEAENDLVRAETAFSKAAACAPQAEDTWRKLLRLRLQRGFWDGVEEALDHLPNDAETRDAVLELKRARTAPQRSKARSTASEP